jgi:hypothetical protein
MAKSNYEYLKAWRKRNPEARSLEYHRRKERDPEKVRRIGLKAGLKHRQANLEKVRAADAARQKARRRNDPEGQRLRMAKFKAKKEAERTKIAGRPRPSICDLCYGNHHLGIVFDHCHQSGKFRGWLCDRCNKVLGLIGDSPVLLRKMARYLDRHNGETDQRGTQLTPIERFCCSV